MNVRDIEESRIQPGNKREEFRRGFGGNYSVPFHVVLKEAILAAHRKSEAALLAVCSKKYAYASEADQQKSACSEDSRHGC